MESLEQIHNVETYQGVVQLVVQQLSDKLK